ncbi:hypothetical protein M7I_7202 [Glarea lozoyensis 74030]|uniref:Uncharacterized protein n=1 Tax=Glarea lozoyensis (strain ATCC 74030 / MF5533) TaxID=1104152 RepID=H0EWN1_GLAL7|nr:hypothetical protein M7I_7202 [Glarea lozoyensis 74030]
MPSQANSTKAHHGSVSRWTVLRPANSGCNQRNMMTAYAFCEVEKHDTIRASH